VLVFGVMTLATPIIPGSSLLGNYSGLLEVPFLKKYSHATQPYPSTYPFAAVRLNRPFESWQPTEETK
jgi:hypothetical protein